MICSNHCAATPPYCHECANKKCFKCGGKPAWADSRLICDKNDLTRVLCYECRK